MNKSLTNMKLGGKDNEIHSFSPYHLTLFIAPLTDGYPYFLLSGKMNIT